MSTTHLAWRAVTSTWIYVSSGQTLVRLAWLANAWVGLSLLVPKLFYGDNEYFTIGMVCTCPLVFAACCYYTSQSRLAVVASSADQLRSEDDRLRFCIETVRLADTRCSESVSINLLRTTVAFQCLRLNVVTFPTPTNPKAAVREQQSAKMLYLLHRRMKEMLLANPNSVALRIFYINFMMRYNDNFSLVWVLAEQTATMDCTWTELFTLFDITYLHVPISRSDRKSLAADPTNRRAAATKNEFNAATFLRQSRIEGKFRRIVEETTMLQSRFWYLMQEKIPSSEAFEEVGFAILRTRLAMERSWTTLRLAGRVSIEIAGLYASYMREVECDKAKASADLDNWNISRNAFSRNNVLRSYAAIGGTAVIAVSAQVQSLGKIKLYNSAFCALSGYLPEELVGLDLDTLTPSIYREVHRAAMSLKSAAFGSVENDFRVEERSVFLLLKSKCVIPVLVKLVGAPNLLNDYMFIATVSMRKDLDGYSSVHLLLGPDKCLRDFTSSTRSCAKYMVDATTVLGLCQATLEETLPISRLVPAFNELKEGVLHHSIAVFGQRTNAAATDFRKLPTKFRCRWDRVLSKKTVLLGYHVTLTHSYLDPLPNRRVGTALPDIPCATFQFVPGLNKYYIDSRPWQDFDSDSVHRSSTLGLESGREFFPRRKRVTDGIVHVPLQVDSGRGLASFSPKDDSLGDNREEGLKRMGTSRPKKKTESGRGDGFYQVLLARIEAFSGHLYDQEMLGKV